MDGHGLPGAARPAAVATATVRSPLRLAGPSPRFLAGLLLTLLAAAPALAQTEAELKAENEALRTRVRDVELELAAARARVGELEREVAALQAQLAAAGGPVGSGTVPPPVQPPATIDESAPTASPRALLAALQADYQEAMADLGGYASPRERTVYLRALERWVANVNREYRSPVEWLVRVERIGPADPRGVPMRVVAVDPGNGSELGDPFEVQIAPALWRRLEQSGTAREGELLELRGVLAPQVAIEPQREAVGTFDQPRFIGPFAEFEFEVQPISIVRAPRPERDEAAPGRP